MPTSQLLLNGHQSFDWILRLMLVKAIIWAVALGSGTSGGVLAPLLMIGGCVGALFGTRAAACRAGLTGR